MKTLSFIFVMMIIGSCHKSPDFTFTDDKVIDIDLPLGESVFYMNGVLQNKNWENHFVWIKLYRKMGLVLAKFEKDSLIGTSLYFNNFDRNKLGIHDLQENSQIKNDGVYIGMAQIFDEDLLGFQYKLLTKEKNMFELVSIDTIQNTVDFKFRVYFRRTAKNENDVSTDEEWPKYIKLEGHFHDYFGFN
jgi:hypothetical protein